MACVAVATVDISGFLNRQWLEGRYWHSKVLLREPVAIIMYGDHSRMRIIAVSRISRTAPQMVL